jgi:hypothetical protein
VMALEMAIAKGSRLGGRDQRRPQGQHRLARGELAKKAPGLDWDAFLTAAGLADQPRFGPWQAAPSRESRKLAGSQPIPGLEGLPGLPHRSSAARRTCPRPSWTRASPSTARR